MTRVIAGMTISLDGFIADREGGMGPLYSDWETLSASDAMRRSIQETGAVLMGRRTFDMAEDPDLYADNYEFQVPIFVLTHTPPDTKPRENERLTFTFVTDGLESAVAQARAAAGERAVTVPGGAEVITALLRAGLADELHIDLMPVLLGAGTRFLDDPALEGVTLERIEVEEVGPRTSLRFRVVR